MNTTNEQRLAAALRAVLNAGAYMDCGDFTLNATDRDDGEIEEITEAFAALAEYDAAPAPGLELDDAERATVLAALRYYQREGMGDPMNRDDDIHEIATDGGEVDSSLDDDGIDELCARLNA